MPIRSSEANMSRACCLVKDMAATDPFYRSATACSKLDLGRRPLKAHVLDDRKHGNGGGISAGTATALNPQRSNVLETLAALFFESLRSIASLPPLRARLYVM